MSLANLVKTGQLKEHPVDQEEIGRLVAAAERTLADTRVAGLGNESKFEIAYRAITQTGIAALMLQGYRPDTNRPGHHMTIIQSLPLTLGIDRERMRVLDTFRRKRNLADYTGEEIDDASVSSCIEQAQKLLQDVKASIKKRK